MSLTVYSSKGVKRGSTPLPKAWQETGNLVLLAQALRVYEDNVHPGLAKVKTRGEVHISTRKIYRQKGTGFARHGAKSAPIFVGGGVTHGPKGLKRKLTLSKKIAKKALGVALGLAIKEGRVVVAESLASVKKSREARDFLSSITEKELGGKIPNRFTVALAMENKNVGLAFRNLKNTEAILFRNLNALKVFNGGLIVVDQEALKAKSTKGIKGETEVTEKISKSVGVSVRVEKKRSLKKEKKTKKWKEILDKSVKTSARTRKS